jgi:hypothetical protein
MGRLHRLVLALALATASAAPAYGGDRGANQLLRVVSPAPRQRARAHPFVNVVLGFGTTPQGVPADPSTFRARMGRVDVTRLFRPVEDRGRVVGMRGQIGPALLRVGGGSNRIRFEVRSPRTPKGRVLRDVDRLRFRADEVDNEPPEVRLVSGDIVVIPGQSVEFDASQSTDPDGDDLEYTWDFGDGTTASGPTAAHVFPDVPGDVTVRVDVSDGQSGAGTEATLFAEPAICPGCTRGILKIEGTQRLEFGAVPVGSTAARTLTVRNPDAAVTSQLAVVLAVQADGFSVSPTELTLGPGESAPVTVTFAPAAEGHHGGTLGAVASASNQRFVHLLAHGYGGAAPNNGPLPIGNVLFFNQFGQGTSGVFPSGARFGADTSIRLCRLGPTTTFDYCLSDADCAAIGGTCAPPGAGRCLRGDRAGQPCVHGADCGNGLCDAEFPFDVLDMCSDPSGGLVVLSEEGTFTDPLGGIDNTRSITMAHAQFDANGQRLSYEIVTRVNDFSSQIACDAAGPGGRVYWAQYQDITSTGDCFRDSRESLLSVRKTGGGQTVVLPRIDAVAGLPECEDIEEVTDLEMTRDASTVYVSMSLGLWRARPSPLLMTPDVDDNFQVHPDGSVIVATVTDQGASGLVRVYKISPDQAVHGAPRLRDLTPCATLTVPNNRPSGSTTGATRIASFAAGPNAPGSFDATILVSVIGSGGSAGGVLPAELRVRGLYAIAAPAASTQCTVLGLVGLDAVDQMTF